MNTYRLQMLKGAPLVGSKPPQTHRDIVSRATRSDFGVNRAQPMPALWQMAHMMMGFWMVEPAVLWRAREVQR